MPQDGKPGRRWKDLSPATSAEAARLATFLRARVDESGLSLEAVGKRIQYSKSTISENLGGKIPSQKFIASLVMVTVRADSRERRQAEAEQLRHAALHPPRADAGPGRRGTGERPGMGHTASAGLLDIAALQAKHIETYESLTKALSQRDELRETAAKSQQLAMVLYGMIGTLQDRVARLTEDRDRLAQTAGEQLAAGARAEETERKLARALEQKTRANSELGRAKQKQREAENLTARLQEKIDRLTGELKDLRAQGATADDPLPDVASAPVTERAEIADPEGDDIEAALVRAEVVNDTDASVVERIATELTHEQEPGSPSVIVPDNAPTSPNVANTLWDVFHVGAQRCGKAGMTHEAVSLANLAVRRAGRELGPDHSDTLTTRDTQAWWIARDGDPAAARDLYVTLILDRTRVLGPNHPETLDDHDDHAWCTGQAGDHATACQLYGPVLDSLTRVLGAEHKNTLNARGWRAEYTGQAGDSGHARDLYALLVEDRTRIQGPDHADTFTARHDHAQWTGKAGGKAEARDLYASLIQDRTRVLGPEHRDTLASRASHAHRTGQADGPAAARDLYAQLIVDFSRTLGSDHAATLTARHNHAQWVILAGAPATARDLYTQIIEDRTRILGKDHPHTLATRHNHAQWTGKTGYPVTARNLSAEVAADRARTLGSEHPDTVKSRKAQLVWSRAVGD